MTLAEIRKTLEKLAARLPPKTNVAILVDTKKGRLYSPIDDVRFDGAQVIIEDGSLRW